MIPSSPPPVTATTPKNDSSFVAAMAVIPFPSMEQSKNSVISDDNDVSNSFDHHFNVHIYIYTVFNAFRAQFRHCPHPNHSCRLRHRFGTTVDAANATSFSRPKLKTACFDTIHDH
jgi:hypothetical protein